MQLKLIDKAQITEYLYNFCIKTGIHNSDDMQMITDTLVEMKPYLYFETLKITLSEYIDGLLDVKAPYKLNNMFISVLINKHFELKRSGSRQFEQDQPDPTPPIEEINKIFEAGIIESKARLKSWLRKEDKYFDPFFLFNEYQWLIDNKGMNPNDYTDEQINELSTAFQKYDKQMAEKPGHLFTPVMTLTEYQKAAVVGLYLK